MFEPDSDDEEQRMAQVAAQEALRGLQDGGQMEIASDHISNADQVSVSEPEPAPSVGTGSFSRTVTPSVERAQPYPNPRTNHCNYYMEEWESHLDGDTPFLAERKVG